MVHKIGDDLDTATDEVVQKLLKGSTQAQAASKKLLSEVWDLPEAEQLETAARYIAEARASKDGKEGLTAFLDKRKPGWMGS